MNGSGPIAVFDMDGVLVHQRSSWRIVHDRLGTSNEDSFIAYIRGEIDDLEFMRRDISLWMGKGLMNIQDVEAAIDDAILIPGFIECMELLKEEGYSLAILSGGLDALARKLGRIGGFDHIISNGLILDKEGGLTGEGELRVPLRDKGSVLSGLLEVGYSPVAVVGDSHVDLSMFALADLSIAFRPESSEVAEAADVVIEEPDLRIVARTVIDRLRGRNRGPHDDRN
ncbi:MAG: HAD-IB family phosphatase [Thermoplasmatota archaeon]